MLSDTKAEQRYRERIVRKHQHVDIFGRAKPLELEKIYISLRVGEYVPPEEKPDEPSRHLSEGPQQRSGIIEATKALYRKPPRLAVLGDPGSGKTTLLRYLAQRVARRDRALGDWARGIMPPGAAYTLDRIQRKLEGFNVVIPGLLAGIMALVLWSIGVFRSYSWFLAFLAGLVLTVALFVIITSWSGRATPIWTTVGVLSLVGSTYFGLVSWWAIGAGGVAPIGLVRLWHG